VAAARAEAVAPAAAPAEVVAQATPAEAAAPADGAARPAPGERGEQARLERWMRAWVAAHARMAAEDVDLDQPLATYGLDSVAAVNVMAELEQLVGQPLDATLVWSHPSIRALAAHLIAGGCRLPAEVAPAGAVQGTGAGAAGSGSGAAGSGSGAAGSEAAAPVAPEPTPAAGGRLSALLDQVESLSEEEVAALLRGSRGGR
jgi:polyketide synthase PksJ